MKNATKKASEIIRELWNYDGKPTQEFNIDGKIIKTNFEAYDLPYWNGTDIPVKYTRENNGINYRSTKPRAEELDECIAQGFDEIRFVLCASGMIRGYCEIFVWAHKSKKAQELAERADQEQAELQNEPDDVELEAQESSQENVDHPHPEAKYNVNRFNKRTGKDESMGIWLGDGMSNFKAGSGFLAGKFYCEDDEWIYYAEEQPQESSEPVAQENIQPELEDATESISEPQEASIPDAKKKYHVKLWKIGTEIDHLQDCGIWDGDGMGNFKAGFGGFVYQDGEWLYYASESSSDSSNEIIKENTAKPTEAKPEPQRDVSLYSLGCGDKTFILVKEREENGLWAYYSVDSNELLWSSAERFSQDDLLRMYENGYFIADLMEQRIRKNDAIKKCKENDFPEEILLRMRNELDAIDDEIARLY